MRKKFAFVSSQTFLDIVFYANEKQCLVSSLRTKFHSLGFISYNGEIKADIRRALCFPGGSTLMVSHLNKDTLMDFRISF